MPAYSSFETDVQGLTQGGFFNFKSFSRSKYPRTIRETYEVAHELWYHEGTYRSAIHTAIAYFITDLNISGASEDLPFENQNTYGKRIKEVIELDTLSMAIGEELIGFGNVFLSLYDNFIRNLVCPECGFLSSGKVMLEEGYAKWKDTQFKGTCPTCNNNVEYEIKDERISDKKYNPSIIRWPPQYMILNYNPISGTTKYYFDIQKYDNFLKKIKSEDTDILLETPIDVLEAISETQAYLSFDEDEICHLKLTPDSYTGASLEGWGLPKFMSEFETVVQLQLLDKQAEAILMSFLTPFRVLSPPDGGSSNQTGGPLATMGGGNFATKVLSMIEDHEKNPTDWNVLPFALNYQALGGEANQLVPIEHIEYKTNKLLKNMGIPQEFYSINNTTTGIPLAAFRLFERKWQPEFAQINKWVTWVSNKIGQREGWGQVVAKYEPVSVFEDPMIKQILLDLSAARQVSKTTAFRALGLDRGFEEKRIVEEEEEYNQRMQESQGKLEEFQINREALRTMSPAMQMLQQEQMQQMQGGMMPPGGGMMPPAGGMMPPGGGLGVGSTIDDLLGQAEQLAQQFHTMPGPQRDSSLRQLKKDSPVLHAQVTQSLKDLEQQIKQEGLNVSRQGGM